MAQDKLLNVEIITPQKKIFAGKASAVSVQGAQSPFQVLYNHAPIVSSLEDGSTKIIEENGKEIKFATGSGFAEVSRNNVSILVETAVEKK